MEVRREGEEETKTTRQEGMPRRYVSAARVPRPHKGVGLKPPSCPSVRRPGRPGGEWSGLLGPRPRLGPAGDAPWPAPWSGVEAAPLPAQGGDGAGGAVAEAAPGPAVGAQLPARPQPAAAPAAQRHAGGTPVFYSEGL